MIIYINLQQLTSMQPGICEQLRPFYFYSLQEFEYNQLISFTKNFVGSYIHKQSKVQFVIKEVPFHQKIIAIIKKIQKLKHKNIATIVGVTQFKSKSGWGHRLKGEQFKEKQQQKEYASLLLFMQKYQMNLHQYVMARKKKAQPLTHQEINAFIHQILFLLQKLERQGISHRDVKPQNILLKNGDYLLCDFDDAILVNDRQKLTVELTTVEYSSPEFLRNIRYPKDKYFDPFKLDVYSFGLTLLFMCSMGKFSLQQRTNYIYESSQRSHADFIKQQRIKWIRNNLEYKSFNSLIKMMLEQDEYKRDDFITLTMKIRGEKDKNNSDNISDDTNNSKSSAKLKNKKMKKILKEKRQNQLRRQQFKVYGILSILMIIIFILFCLL